MRMPRPGVGVWVLLAFAVAPTVAGQDVPGSELPITGIVVDVRTGSGVPAAVIRFLEAGEGVLLRETRSDRDGRFYLPDLSAGSYRLEVVALSYRNLSESVEILGLGPTDIRIEIVSEALELDPIVVTTTSGGWLARTGFFERRNRGIGTFLTRAEIHRYTTGPFLSDVFRMMPGARVVPPGEFGDPHRVEFRDGCEASIFVDGNPMMSETTLDEVVQSFDVEALEVYRGITVPPRFAGRGSCGAIVVWTREPGSAAGSSGLLPNLGRALLGVGTILTAVLIGF